MVRRVHQDPGMNSHRTLLFAAALTANAALATEVTVNAAEDRKVIAARLYDAPFGDAAQQQAAGGALGIALLLGQWGQQGASAPFNEAPLVPTAPAAAVRLYTDYDGQGARFGDTSIAASSANPLLFAFAAFDLDAHVTVVLLNQGATAAEAVAIGFKGVGQKGAWRAFALAADGQLSPAGSGTTYDALILRTVPPRTALLVEYRPVGGILPIQAAAPVQLPAARTVEAPAAPMGCSATEAGLLSLSLLVLVGVVRRRSLN